MRQYVAFLRGINISGKNKISMKELNQSFMKNGFKDVKTYINSGNIVFNCEGSSIETMIIRIENLILDDFGLTIPTAVYTQLEIKNLLENAPHWWGNDDKTVYHNTIFLLPSINVEDVYQAVGEFLPEYENIAGNEVAIYWSAKLETFSKSRYSKIANTKINNYVTLRTANTVKKIYNFMIET